jgi:hypothetical protein
VCPEKQMTEVIDKAMFRYGKLGIASKFKHSFTQLLFLHFNAHYMKLSPALITVRVNTTTVAFVKKLNSTLNYSPEGRTNLHSVT